jgi:hypothetical protein
MSKPAPFENQKYRPDFARYEREKQDWIRRHPAATPEQYQAAMVKIATRCGI